MVRNIDTSNIYYLCYSVNRPIALSPMASVKSAVRAAIKEDYGYRCMYCFQKFPPNKLQIHHIYPREFGINNHYTNLLPICDVHHLLIHKKKIQFNSRGRRILYVRPEQNVTKIYIKIKVVH
jgi:5-methylcytosine-specific restriction endonuclease McrA